MSQSPPSPRVAVVMPAFPRSPALKRSLASLREQSRPADHILLLDDGSNKDAASLRDDLGGSSSELLAVPPGSLPAALNKAVEHLAAYQFVSFLQGGDLYAPTRLERCLQALDEGDERRPFVLAITGMEIVDSRGKALPPDDAKVVRFARLWEPGKTGISASEWLGLGNFTGPLSNIFARRDHLAANPFVEIAASFHHLAAIAAAVQELLVVIDEPLLRHHALELHQGTSLRGGQEILMDQLHLLNELGRKLDDSPLTRRNFAAFHRAAWHNVSGLREDLFQQTIMRLAAAVPLTEAKRMAGEIIRARDAQNLPAHLEDAAQTGAAPDLPAYAAALQKARTELAEAQRENRRLAKIAAAIQGSGWVRFGAWVGDRSARRMMEMEDELTPEATAPPTTTALVRPADIKPPA
jgi:glycosyltransferase involved in cell wall biosynthesis